MCCSLKSLFKFGIIFTNIPILIVGLVSLGTGIWVVVDEDSFFSTYTNIIDLSVVDKNFIREAAIVLLSAGTATALFALIGIAAARSSSAFLLGFYIIIVCMLIGVEVAAVTLGIIFKEKWERKLDEDVLYKIQNFYNGTNSSNEDGFTTSLNLLHQAEHCCGWINGTDFTMTKRWNRTTAENIMMVPNSCCVPSDDLKRNHCIYSPNMNNSYVETGCKDKVQSLFTSYQGVVIGLGVCILALELVMVILAVCLLTHSVSNKYDVS